MPNKSKQKRWRKGQSCVTNPVKSKYRSAAKNRFFTVQTGPSSLTVDAVEKHEAKEGEYDILPADIDSLSLSGRSTKTAATSATNLTSCTNVSFGKIIHRFSTSHVAAHKEVLSVLAAVSEVIRDQGRTDSDTAYFAVLMSSLNSDSFQNDQSISSALFLLSLVIRRVPRAVLQSRFSDTVKVLLSFMDKRTEATAPALYRSVIVCLTELLKAQDLCVWNEGETQHVYQTLLTLVISSKAKVRRAAQEGVTSVLCDSTCMTHMINTSDQHHHHPAAAQTALFCITKLKQTTQDNTTVSLHILELLKTVMGEFTKSHVKSVCETLLHIMSLSHVMLREVAMKTFSKLFSSQPRIENLPADYNAKIITVLHEYMPHSTDIQSMQIWLDVMKHAHINLVRLDSTLALNHLPRFFISTFKCLQVSGLAKTALSTTSALMKECIEPVRDLVVKMLTDCPSGRGSTPIDRIVRCVESGLSYQYATAWDSVLAIITLLFEILGKGCNEVMRQCLRSLAELRDSSTFQHKDELDKAVGMAVKTMGPKVVLDCIPLGITSDSVCEDKWMVDGLTHSWVLPVLRDHLQDTQLQFFSSYFLPIAEKLDKKIVDLRNTNSSMAQLRVCEALQHQVWSLLPGFCTHPTDMTQSFPLLAKTLGITIRDKPSTRLEVLTALRKLINETIDKETEERAVMRRYSQNFLPILFNLYLSHKSKQKDPSLLAVLETIKLYLKIADETLIAQYSGMCYEKLNSPEVEAVQKCLLMDIAIRMVPHLNETSLNSYLSFACKQIQINDKTQQKKAYRILEEIFRVESVMSDKVIVNRLQSIQDQMMTSLSGTHPSSKAARLHCLVYLIKHLSSSSFSLLTLIMPEVILCTKATGTKARQAAFSLLIEMGHTYIRWSADLTDNDALCKYISHLMAGLASSSHHLIACTMLALTKVIFDFKDLVSMSLLTAVVDSVSTLLMSSSREVVQSSLGLVKALFSAFSNTFFSQFLHTIVCTITAMKEPMRLHFRTKVKDLFSRLTRKYGYELVVGMVPENQRKLLNSIHKAQERAKRQKSQGTSSESGEDDENDESKDKVESLEELLQEECDSSEDEMSVNHSKKTRDVGKMRKERRQRGGGEWLMEEDEDIVDFMDPSAASKISTTRPGSGCVRNEKSESRGAFKTAADGRLIITEEGDDRMPMKSSLTQNIKSANNLDCVSSKKMTNRKRKLTRRDSMSDHDEDECKQMKYKAGGQGIHRPIKKETETKHFKSKSDNEKKRLDPYVYLPLKFQSLNKRKKAKVSGQFKNLVRGAQQGASKGHKLKKKKERNH